MYAIFRAHILENDVHFTVLSGSVDICTNLLRFQNRGSYPEIRKIKRIPLKDGHRYYKFEEVN